MCEQWGKDSSSMYIDFILEILLAMTKCGNFMAIYI